MFDPIAIHRAYEESVSVTAGTANVATTALLSRPGDAGLDLLVMVHPGSLIGSLEMHVADCPDIPDTRQVIANLVASWPGDTAVLFGDLTDELAQRDTEERAAIADMAATLYERGSVLLAPPFAEDLEDAAAWLILNMAGGERPRIVVTGIWADEKDGCVTVVADFLRQYTNGVVEVPDFTPRADRPSSRPEQ